MHLRPEEDENLRGGGSTLAISLIAAQAPYQGYVRTALDEPGSPAQRSASRGENPAIITKIAFPRVSRQLFAVL